MNIFVFTPSSDVTTLDQAKAVNDYTRVTWVERYNAPGEFTIEAKLSSGLTSVLPLGSLISHVDSTEIMIVENHEVLEKMEENSTIAITGRSFVSFLENRIAGLVASRSNSTVGPYVVGAAYSWEQIVTLINNEITSGGVGANDAVTNFSASHSMSGSGVSVARTIEYGSLLGIILDLLKIDDLGIRTVRRNPFGAAGGSDTESRINVYKGADKTATIMFSWVAGDIAEAHYLFSVKDDKNCALVLGTYVRVVVDGPEVNYNRRSIVVDGKDIDGQFGAMPTGADLTTALAAMTTRGQQALAAQNQTSITQVDLSATTKPQYRKDYNIGDLVSIDGNYGQIAVRRITEYAEIEDETGKTSHPTLSIPGA